MEERGVGAPPSPSLEVSKHTSSVKKSPIWARNHPFWVCAAAHPDISKARRSSHPDLTVGFEAFYNHLPLGLILKEVTEELFLIWIVLTNSLQAPLYPTIYIVWVKGQPKVEDLPIVTMVVPNSCPASETLFPSPTE
jgi:hypothetical protein